MIRQKMFRRFQVQYHRNGVSGEGFHLCEFLLAEGRYLKPLRAVVFSERGQVAVMSDDFRERWRGDEFEDALREAIAAVEKAQPERMHEAAQ